MATTNAEKSISKQSASGFPIPAIPSSSIIATDAHPNIQVQNIVCSVNLSCPLNLTDINNRLRLSEYNPKRFPGAVLRLLEPKVTALAFASGKMVVCGARHETLASLGARKFARILQKIGYNVCLKDFKINNMLGTSDLKFPVRLEDLNESHPQFSRFEPELFPALIYRLVRPRTVVLIFVNGKVVITGGKSREELQLALDTMYPILRSFRKS
ncbi:hypothetical protein V9T40_013598 [Parthenolecanium corni]|uniref:TATA-box-binding protein n=1 Tax=Parthenolecanium corni TaxID=536013 RepID=A0AAN9TDM2_9HEMI